MALDGPGLLRPILKKPRFFKKLEKKPFLKNLENLKS